MHPLPKTTLEAISPWHAGIFDLAVFTFFIIALLVLLLFLAGWLGEKRPGAEKLRPYESGIIPTGSARYRYPVPFYLVATFFLIFDVEAAFIFSWAVAFNQLGLVGWLHMCFFIIVLLISLIYIWMKGGLEWGPARKP